jgi:hypothetical protein
MNEARLRRIAEAAKQWVGAEQALEEELSWCIVIAWSYPLEWGEDPPGAIDQAMCRLRELHEAASVAQLGYDQAIRAFGA